MTFEPLNNYFYGDSKIMIINYSRGEEPYTIQIGEDDRVGILMLHSNYKCTSIINENFLN